MATSTRPSAAQEALCTTDEKANFQRLTRLLMRGGLALLREVFDAIYPPVNLPAVLGNPAIKTQLQSLKRIRILNQTEWDYLYNSSGPGMHGKSADFDISLLCKLLRAICSLPPPITGWDNLPSSSDQSLGADLVRIRIYRNTIYGHNHSMEIKKPDFEKLWKEISEALLRIASSISSAKRDEWKKSIEKFFHEPLTPYAKECVDERREWYLMDMDTKNKLEKLDTMMEQLQLIQEQMKCEQEQMKSEREQMKSEQEQMKSEQKQMRSEQEQRHIEILIAIKSLKANGSADSSSAQVEGDQLATEILETRVPIPGEQSSAEGIAGLSTSTELQNSPVVLDFWYVVCSFKRPLELLIRYLKIKLGVDVQSYRPGSFVITVSCSSLKVLEALWNEYRTGRLNEVVQDTLVTGEVLEKLELSEVKLRTIISEEDYLSYKEFLKNRSGNDEIGTHSYSTELS